MTDKHKAEAARQFSEAVGFAHAPEQMDVTEYNSRAEWLAAHGGAWNSPASPQWWAGALATETAERQGWAGMRGMEMLLVSSANNLCTLEAATDDLPLLQWPNVEAWPKGQPLPDNWRIGLFMRKADLREWAKTHAPQWLGAALLAEAESAPADRTPAEEWSQASAARKNELAAEAMKRHGKQAKAAASLGISRQRLATVLRNGSATVASDFPESRWKPRKR
ncbi:MAG: hypothetical protein PHO64_14415 [Thiomonas sp.]|nr:hypothetical protein [Thiomonas sp.]